jgi:hypothetical protein
MSNFWRKENRGGYKDPAISIRESTGLSIYKSAVQTLFKNFEGDGDPQSVKVGVDDDAKWIVLLPVADAEGYSLPGEVKTHSLSSTSIMNFILEEASGLHEDDTPIKLTGFWDETEGALLFEYD